MKKITHRYPLAGDPYLLKAIYNVISEWSFVMGPFEPNRGGTRDEALEIFHAIEDLHNKDEIIFVISDVIGEWIIGNGGGYPATRDHAIQVYDAARKFLPTPTPKNKKRV